MASWLFIQKEELQKSDHLYDVLMKERRTYQSLLDSYVKFRKSNGDHLLFLKRLTESVLDQSLD